VFRIKHGDKALEDLFLQEGEKEGIYQLCGHPLFGGLRIILYNTIATESVERLLVYMKKFAQNHHK